MIALGRVIPAAFLAAVGLTALRPIDDADFWWLLRAGRYMVETRTFLTDGPVLGDRAGRGVAQPCLGLRAPRLRALHPRRHDGRHPPPGAGGVGDLRGALRSSPAGRRGAGMVPRAPEPRRPGDPRLLVAAPAAGHLSHPGPLRARPRRLPGRAAEPPVVAPGPDRRVGEPARRVPGGPALVALCAAGELVGWALGDDTGRAGGLARARVLAFWSAASVAASLANPFHYHAVLFPFQVMGERLSQAWIIEWASPPFGHPQVLVLELMLGLDAGPRPWGPRARSRGAISSCWCRSCTSPSRRRATRRSW